MAKINFKNGRVEDYTIVLSTRDYRHLGQLSGIKSDDVQKSDSLSSANEISFSLSKFDLLKDNNVMTDDEFKRYQVSQTVLWNQIVDFRLIWIKEINEYYEIKVAIDDAAETLKTITATSLCEAELSQYNIDSLEINSESDIERDDYVVTTFCNFDNPNASLLHRALVDKAPHYTIEHVDESLCNVQRTFSVNGSNIYDFFTGEVTEQVNCLFVFNSATRGISVYDLYTICLDCGHREDFYDDCPKCGSKNLKYFGKDTTILVDKNNLTDSIHLETNADERKNCLKLLAGDDLMTATIRLLNQNGSDYLYYISEFQMDDMPKELVDRLQQYQKDYDSKTEEYQKAMSDYYEFTDEILYLKSGMMPTIEQSKVTAKTEADKLTESNLSPMAISSVTTATYVSTVNSALKNYAKVYVKSGYVKIEINDGATFTYVGEHTSETALDSYHYGYWTGSFTITNYSDKKDIVVTEPITIMVYDNYKDFIEQKVLKQLASTDDEASVFDVLAINDLDEFKYALTLYGLNRLTSYYDAIQSSLDVLVQLNQGAEDAELYDVLYKPYYLKLQACQTEIDVRQDEIDKVQKKLDDANNIMTSIQSELNLRTYLGEELYAIFCAYKREDTYSNANYISDGLNNVDLINKAKEFLEAANKELKRVAEPQYTITSTLKNLLVLDEFKPIIDYFELGNWIRVKVENNLYRLRLIGYSMNFGNLQDIGVEFSTVTKLRDVAYEAQQVIKATQSMSTSFDYIAKQAEKGNVAKSNVDDWFENGLNSALVNITSNDGNITQNDHGILCRYFDEETGEYSPKQLKILYNNIALTKDGWKTCAQAIGEHSYSIYNPGTNQIETYTGYGVTAEFISAPHMTGKTIIGGNIYSTNYSDGSFGRAAEGTFMNLDSGTFSFAGGNLKYDGEDLIISSKSIGESLQDIDVTAENLNINASNIQGKITASQIETVNANQITGDISVNAKNINGELKSSQIESLVANKITGKITASQIDSIDVSQITGKIEADSVKAENIDGVLDSDQITSDLDGKNFSGSFEGSVSLSAVTTVSDEIVYNAVSGEFTVGNVTLKFVNGILVDATPVAN